MRVASLVRSMALPISWNTAARPPVCSETFLMVPVIADCPQAVLGIGRPRARERLSAGVRSMSPSRPPVWKLWIATRASAAKRPM